MQQKNREYSGMLRLGCRRKPQSEPALIRSVGLTSISSVAAGYAHCMLLSEDGRLFAAGYNDRGQLGLGHRISTSDFKYVAYEQSLCRLMPSMFVFICWLLSVAVGYCRLLYFIF